MCDPRLDPELGGHKISIKDIIRQWARFEDKLQIR